MLKNQLFELIKAMSQVEKRNFKLYANKRNTTDAKHYLALFEQIAALPNYDETKLKAKLTTTQVKNFAVKKNQLYNLLLRFLRDYYSGKKQTTAQIRLQELLTDIAILLDKGLREQAFRRIQQAEKLARACQAGMQLVYILNQKHSLERRFGKGNLNDTLKAMHLETKLLLRKLAADADVIEVYEAIFMSQRGAGRKSTPELNLEELIQQLRDQKITENDLSLRGAMAYHFIYIVYYNTQKKYAKIEYHCQKMLHLLESNPALLRTEQERYLNVLYTYFTNYILVANDFQKIPILLQKLNALHPQSELIRIRQLEHGFYYTLIFNQREQNFQQSLQVVPQLQELFAEQALPANREVILRSMIAAAYLLEYSFNKTDNCLDHASEWTNKILENRRLEQRKDILIWCQIILALIAYEQTSDYLIDYHLQAGIRLLPKTKDPIFQTYRNILNGLRRAINQPFSERNTIFHELHTQTANMHFEEIHLWLSTKIKH